MVRTISPVVLKSSFLFKDAGTEILSDVAKHCQRMELPAGDILFAQDSDPDAMYFLEAGQIHVVRHYSSGREVILATEVPYYVIGELSLLANRPRTGSVVAVGNCDLLRISRSDIEAISHKHPGIPLRTMKHLGERLYKLNLRVRENAIGNVTARVASALLLIANEQEGEIRGAVNHTHLARATALDIDMLEHTLKEWSDSGLVSIKGQTMWIHDLNALKNIAG